MSQDPESGYGIKAENISVGFKDLSVYSLIDSNYILKNVSGYVVKGGITAVLGPSAAGKSVLLKTLSGRIQDLDVLGDVYMNGRIVNPKNIHNPVAYVPQNDSVLGELTAREVTKYTAMFKRNDSEEVIEKDVADLLKKLGIDHVADGIIGTLIFRGLSGGQKKRAEIACELIASPSILILDEPTSGLDSSVAFEVLSCIHDLVKSSEGKFSVMLSIHQPNSRMLQLFDHIMLMESGGGVFFGALSECEEYFSRHGFSCPTSVTPTDYFLQITDKSFSIDQETDFSCMFHAAPEGVELRNTLENHKKICETGTHSVDVPKNTVPFIKQLYLLIYRDYTLAYRDPTLYHFQLNLMLSFAVLIGAVFWNLPRQVDGSFNIFSSALLWIVLSYCWVHAFKVYYLSSSTKRATHEVYNAKYSKFAVLLSDTISTATLGVMFFPVGVIMYFMMGFPARAYPFLILAGWMVFMTAEAMIAVVTLLSNNPTTSMVFAQICLVNLQVFGGGVFVAWNDCPRYWIWLQEATVFAQGSRTISMEVFQYMDFRCDEVDSEGQCIEPGTGIRYECDYYHDTNAGCEVNGREMLEVNQGIQRDESYWEYFGYMCIIFVGLKLGVAFLTYYPVDSIFYWAKSCYVRTPADNSTAASNASCGNDNSNSAAEKSIYTSVQSQSVVSPADQIQGRTVRQGSFHEESHGSLSWSNLSVVLSKTGQRLVDDVSGYVQPGRVLALMGPSGAGKTTLLNGLAKRASYAKLEGSVKFLGKDMTSHDLTYVPQFDEVNDVLTVFQHVLLVGRLTCHDCSKMEARAMEILKVLGLTEKKDTQVRHLSGGEIKRVSIGVGLISNPSILFLDEPTTGVDSTASYSIVKYLASVAKTTNIAIIMTIHQPSALVFEMLDDLFLLEAGRMVYGGSIADAKHYFSSLGYTNPEKINPADYYLDLVQSDPKGHDKTWTELFNESEYGNKYYTAFEASKKVTSSVEPRTPPSILNRLIIMILHFLYYFMKEPGYFVYRVYSLIIVAVFEGTLFLDLDTETDQINAYVGAMCSTAVAVMLCAVTSTSLFARDRREAVDRVANGFYSPGVYVVAQFIVSTVYNLFAAFIFVCIFHWLVDLNPHGETFLYDIFISWGHLILQESAIMVIVEVLKNDFLSTTAGMIFIGTNMLFSGFFREQSAMPKAVAWLCSVVPLHWSFNGFTWMIFRDQDFTVSGSDPKIEMTGKQVLDQIFNLRDIPAWGMLGVLLAYVVFFRVSQYFLFALQTNKLTIPLLPFKPESSVGTPDAMVSDREEQKGEGYEIVKRSSDDKMESLEMAVQDERNACL